MRVGLSPRAAAAPLRRRALTRGGRWRRSRPLHRASLRARHACRGGRAAMISPVAQWRSRASAASGSRWRGGWPMPGRGSWSRTSTRATWRGAAAELATAVAPEAIYSVECDVFAPCASAGRSTTRPSRSCAVSPSCRQQPAARRGAGCGVTASTRHRLCTGLRRERGRDHERRRGAPPAATTKRPSCRGSRSRRSSVASSPAPASATSRRPARPGLAEAALADGSRISR